MKRVLIAMALIATGCGSAAAGGDELCDADGRIDCTHETTLIEGRDVHWRLPSGAPPADGWPVVLLFQGTGVAASKFWKARRGEPAGAYWQARTVVELLGAGYAVMTPTAPLDGHGAWQTNVPPHAGNWAESGDRELIDTLFAEIEDGTFGEVSSDAVFAAGISSGGYMSSRIAVTYPERVGAIAVHSASYATCKGPICDVPELAGDHPPTLLLHGALDPVVPVGTMTKYADALEAAGAEVDTSVQPGGTHAWFSSSPGRIREHFDAHRESDF